MRAAPNISPTVAKSRARVAWAVQNDRPDDEVQELRRDLKHAKAADFISKIVAEAPRLTDSQLEELAGLLLPVPRGAGAA